MCKEIPFCVFGWVVDYRCSKIKEVDCKDGYEHESVVRPQQLPKYLSAVRYATQGSPEAMKEARKVFYNIERLSRSGAPTKSLKAAYSNLVKAAQTGTEEQLEKACYVAIQEKSRYVAQRIIRTELSRAYSDGFNAKIMQDDDVVAVRLRLSTRHPVFDICNLFAEADMYGLGKGVYPKDKAPPIPLHPHCMCRLEEVYAWEVDISKQKDNVKQAGDKWMNGLSDVNRRRVLGIEGDEAWKQGESWQKYMRNWRGLVEAETRLKDLVREQSYSYSVGSPICDFEYINSEKYRRKFDKLSEDRILNQAVYKHCKSMLVHQSGKHNENLCIITADGKKVVGVTSGAEKYATRYTDKLDKKIAEYKPYELVSMHNHGTNLPPTGSDFVTAGSRKYKFGVVACHDGKVFYYSSKNAMPFTRGFFDAVVEKFTQNPYNLNRYDAVIKTLEQFSKDYGVEWRELE